MRCTPLFLIALLAAIPRTATACTIDLASSIGSDQQSICAEVLDQTISPIQYHVTGVSSFQITGLPPGITAAMANDTITISGIAGVPGNWFYEIGTPEGCGITGVIGIGQSIDWDLACSVAGDSMTVTWAEDIALSTGDVIYFVWEYDSSVQGVGDLVLPASSFTIPDLPPGTEVTFTMNSVLSSAPYCAVDFAQVTCNTTPLAMVDIDAPTFRIVPNPAVDVLHITGMNAPASVSVLDISGRRSPMVRSVSQSGDIEVSSLAPGSYILQVAGDAPEMVRFIKQ